MIPTVGRIVHYMNLGDKDGKYPPETQAAIVVKATITNPANVVEGSPVETHYDVTLAIFYPTGLFWREKVPFSPTPERGCWFWPEIKR